MDDGLGQWYPNSEGDCCTCPKEYVKFVNFAGPRVGIVDFHLALLNHTFVTAKFYEIR